MNAPQRLVAVLCRDWPVVASERSLERPVAVVTANRVVATSPVARRHGVTVGLRRREAQRRCPSVEVVSRDTDREARAFTRVLTALDAVTARLEVVRPGLVVFPARGPSRFFGGEDAVVERVRGVLVGLGLTASIGVADGAFAAVTAARRSPVALPVVVGAGESAVWLAPLPVGELGMAELCDVLGRLGLLTLGSFAALAVGDVTARFGVDGVRAHRLANGLDADPRALVDPPPDLTATTEVDPPAERVDQAAFVAKALADDFCARLAGRGASCARVRVVAETVGGELIERVWRDECSLTPLAIAQRIRWQLDGWLATTARDDGRLYRGVVTTDDVAGDFADHPAAICRITLVPEEVGVAAGAQLGFWGGRSDAAQRALAAAERVATMLGEEQVTRPVLVGGRGPQRHRLVPIGSEIEPGRAPDRDDGAPVWPGRLPSPSPARVWDPPLPAHVVDAHDRSVAVGGRGVASAAPSRISIRGGPWFEVVAWAGPWTSDERWWDPVGHRRRARFQVVAEGGVAHLLTIEDRRWWLEATYD